MRTGRVAACLVPVAIVAIFWPRIEPEDPATPPGSGLPGFEGSIDNDRLTFDLAKSDLAVRAAGALEAGDAAAAEALYRQAVEAYPEDSGVYSDLGACLFFRGRHDEARAAFARALELDPRSADALYGLGCVGYKEGTYSEARDHLARALESREGHALTHRTLALVYDQLLDPARARAHYARAAALSPEVAAEPHVRDRLAELPP